VNDRRRGGQLVLSVALLQRSVLVHIDHSHLASGGIPSVPNLVATNSLDPHFGKSYKWPRRRRLLTSESVNTMPLTNRTHAITFRLGAREYEELVKTVASKGSRSVSEFTRSAVLNSIITDRLDQFLESELEALMSSLDAFDTKVRDLRRQIRQLAIKPDSPIN
jgi:hypothetical protein